MFLNRFQNLYYSIFLKGEVAKATFPCKKSIEFKWNNFFERGSCKSNFPLEENYW